MPRSLHAQQIHHEIKAVLIPERHGIQVQDRITLPATLVPAAGGEVNFVLHAGLHVVSSFPGVLSRRNNTEADRTQSGMTKGASSEGNSVPLERFTITLPPGERTIVLEYHGGIDHPLVPQGEEYARGFRETPGVISFDGAYLAGVSYWYPRLDDDLVSFTLDVKLPQGWSAVSQGTRTRYAHKDESVLVRWESPEPQDEIFLIAGPFTEYARPSGEVEIMAFLRQPDEDLAKTYLKATAQYLEMYDKLIGPYPYTKFALVENFWETGYGMPSFALLGPRVIRLPFILHSSYPHEILHNWWGNGVFVDYQVGNWSEGLTAYLADHLIQEQRGTAQEYRRATLQKYTDYVSTRKDFPITAFHSRRSSATEAVGYGKTLMFFHMLRQRLGDKTFTEGLQKFFRENKFRRAGFSDLQHAFSAEAGDDLEPEFAQWITRPGAPALRVTQAGARPDNGGYLLTVGVEQTQPGPAYTLHIPIAVHLQEREMAFQRTVPMKHKRIELTFRVPGRPFQLDVDPEFDVFRRLDRRETPPALTQAFGADKALIVLPDKAPDQMRQGYQDLARVWQQSQPSQIDIKWDTEIHQLPADRAVWVFGWENRFQPEIVRALADYDVSFTQNAVRIGPMELSRRDHSIVLSARRVANSDLALTWVASDDAAAMPGLGRKLPHYHKYSYLGFKGDEPTNIAKGTWPVHSSPMSIPILQPDGGVIKGNRGKLAPRRPLVPPAGH